MTRWWKRVPCPRRGDDLQRRGEVHENEEAREFFGDIERVAVKEGMGWSQAKCMPLEEAHERIREAAARAVRRARAGEFPPWVLEPPMEMKLELTRTRFADELASRPGVERLDARTVRKFIQSAKEVYRW
jgi:D-amino peptidase